MSRHLPVEKGVDGAAHVESSTMWMYPQVDHGGVKVVGKVEWLIGSKSTQKREKIDSARTGKVDLSKRPRGGAPSR